MSDLNVLQFVESPLGLGCDTLYPVQRIVLKLIYGLSLDDHDPIPIRIDHTGTTRDFTEFEYAEWLKAEGRFRGKAGSEQVNLVMCRRGGKTFMSHLILAYETYLTLAANRNQLTDLVRVTVNKDLALHHHTDLDNTCNKCHYLKGQCHTQTRTSLYFSDDDRKDKARVTSCSIRSAPNTIRGRWLRTAVLDEAAYMNEEALRKTITTVRQAYFASPERRMILTSSPSYAEGTFYEHHTGYAGLALRIPTWEANADVDNAFLIKQHEKAPENFAVEYGAEFKKPEPKPNASEPCPTCGCGGCAK